jgi:hypothetical protein
MDLRLSVQSIPHSTDFGMRSQSLTSQITRRIQRVEAERSWGKMLVLQILRVSAKNESRNLRIGADKDMNLHRGASPQFRFLEQ